MTWDRATSSAISEKLLWKWLSSAKDDTLHMERVENLVAVGGADVSGCYDRGYFDIELKTADRPRCTKGVILNSKASYVRPSQKVWHTLRWRAGGQNYVLIQVGQKAGALRYLVPGNLIRQMEDTDEWWFQDATIIDPTCTDPVAFIRKASTYRRL